MMSHHGRYREIPGFGTLISLFLSAVSLSAAENTVSSLEDLQQALRQARPGDTVRLASGEYRGSVRASQLQGTAAQPITLTGESPDNPPVIHAGATGLHLSKVAHIHLRDLVIVGATQNGINIDDGGQRTQPSHHLLLEHLTIRNTGPRGNKDGIKLSGIDHFTVRHCTISGWGGSAIDMVGCHEGTIAHCHFEGREGHSQSNAVQMKGGSRHLRVLHNTFLNPGQRAINVGGHTGLPYFRPEVGDFEAADIEVAGNTFHGSMGPIAWATARGGRVHHNTILFPEKWVARILQENADPRFQPSQNGRFEHNVVVYDDRVRVPINVGGGTSPETFVFKANTWLNASGRPPQLPTPETDGTTEVAPGPEDLTARLTEAAGAGRGAMAYQAPPLLASNFEEGEDWQETWGLRQPSPRVATVAEDPARGFEPLNGRALRIKVEKGGHYGASLTYPFRQRLGREPEEIFFRYYLRFGSDWKPQRGGKLPGIAGTYGRAGWGGRPVDGTDGWSARGLFAGQQEGKTPIGFYCYHADMKGKYGAHWEWERKDRGLLENKRWYCIAQQVKMNTPGKNDGILRGWVDGKLAFERTDVRFRDVPELKIETVWLNLYHGGSWTAQEDHHLYIDEVRISPTYLAPIPVVSLPKVKQTQIDLTIPSPKDSAGGLLVADVNNDALPDILVTVPGHLTVIDNRGGELWTKHVDIGVGGQSESQGLPGHDGPGVAVGDIDADGNTEVIYLTRNDPAIYAVDGATGEIESTATPRIMKGSARWEQAMVADFRGTGGDTDLLLQATNKEGYRTGRFLAAYTAKALFSGGEPMWNTNAFAACAHNGARLADLDGDGRDEILGEVILTPEGTLLTRPLPFRGHMDSVFARDVRPDLPGIEVVMLEEGSNHVQLLGINGVIWRKANFGAEGRGREPQNAAVGRFKNGDSSVFLWCRSRNAKHQTPFVFDAQGELVFGYEMDAVKPEGWTDSGVEVIHTIDWTGSETQLACAKERHTNGHVGIFDPLSGNFIERFHVNADRLYVADIRGDWREEVIVLQGNQLVIFENLAENPRPHQPRLWEDRNYRRLKQCHNYYSP